MSTGQVALITGGAGFIGTNLALRLLSQGRQVLLFDNLSRPGVERNVREILERHAPRAEVQVADVLDMPAVRAAVGRAQEVYHLAAQVAVTTSLQSPLRDFDVNARGTLNVLEAARLQPVPPPVVYASTNKVYGALTDVRLTRQDRRYTPVDPALRAQGIDESRPLDFHSPYACSKGTADQYVRDYARSFGLPTIVLRLSCIYGPHQQGNADQGWVAHFALQTLRQQPLTIFGDGCQVRDVLFVDDLVDALVTAMQNIGCLAGQVFNVGGGSGNTVSLLELTARLAGHLGLPAMVRHAPWRQGDQRYYVSNVSKLARATGWSPRVGVDEGLRRLHAWLGSASVCEQAVEASDLRACSP